MDEEVFQSASKIAAVLRLAKSLSWLFTFLFLPSLALKGQIVPDWMVQNRWFRHFRSIDFIAYLYSDDVCFVFIQNHFAQANFQRQNDEFLPILFIHRY